AQGSRGRVFVHEEAGAVARTRPVELPELAKRGRLAARVVLHRLRVGPDGPPLQVEDADGIRNDVEDRAELGDAAGEVFAQVFPLGDVVARKEQSSIAKFVLNVGKRCFYDAPAVALLKGNVRGGDQHGAAQGAVDLFGEVRERVGERVVDGELAPGIVADPGQRAVAGIRADEPQLAIVNGERERHRLEE